MGWDSPDQPSCAPIGAINLQQVQARLFWSMKREARLASLHVHAPASLDYLQRKADADADALERVANPTRGDLVMVEARVACDALGRMAATMSRRLDLERRLRNTGVQGAPLPPLPPSPTEVR